jgi:uncharacterized protein YdhG (YjbR/CyaY superfamily)
VGDVDDYIASLPAGAERSELSRLHQLIIARVPAVGQTTSYAMPCYTYRDVPVAAVVVRKHHIAWYPFSGNVLPVLQDQLAGYSWSPGTLRFTAAAPLPDGLVTQLIDLRMRHIDDRSNA